MQSRYRTVIDGAYLSDPAHDVRWRKTLEFLRKSSLVGASHASGLDLGDRTPFTLSLERLFGCPFENTTVDLDIESLAGSFGVVTAFEVLEHLYNPLHALLEVRRLLAGQEARLFVSMPLWKPLFLASPNHFHEMTRTSALSLFRRGGFCVVARPDLVGELEDAKIGSSAAAGATLPNNVGMTLTQHAPNVI